MDISYESKIFFDFIEKIGIDYCIIEIYKRSNLDLIRNKNTSLFLMKNIEEFRESIYDYCRIGENIKKMSIVTLINIYTNIPSLRRTIHGYTKYKLLLKKHEEVEDYLPRVINFEFLYSYKKYLNWKNICKSDLLNNLHEEFLERIYNQLDWIEIFRNQYINLSMKFIEKYYCQLPNKIYDIIKYRKLNEEFIKKHRYLLDVENILVYQNFNYQEENMDIKFDYLSDVIFDFMNYNKHEDKLRYHFSNREEVFYNLIIRFGKNLNWFQLGQKEFFINMNKDLIRNINSIELSKLIKLHLKFLDDNGKLIQYNI